MEVRHSKQLVALALFTLAFSERVIFDLGPNIELITLAMIISAAYLGKKYSLWLVFLIMITSDILIGNTNIFLFTWTGFLIPAVLVSGIFKKHKKANKTMLATATGLSSTLFFWIWTNFGVWLLDSWGMYSNDLSGLLLSYTNALPFLKLHISSTLLTIPLCFHLVELSIVRSRKLAIESSPSCC